MYVTLLVKLEEIVEIVQIKDAFDFAGNNDYDGDDGVLFIMYATLVESYVVTTTAPQTGHNVRPNSKLRDRFDDDSFDENIIKVDRFFLSTGKVCADIGKTISVERM